AVTRVAVLECAGNGRAFFPQPTATVRWRHGAVGCVAWTGVKLADLLEQCVLKPEAVYTGHYSPDLSLDGSGPALSRGFPIAKALAPETIVAYGLNVQPIPLLHGGPLRIVAPGYPASASQKWLTRIWIRDREHDGVRMTGLFYRMPKESVRPDGPIDPSQFEVLTDMPVRSIITLPSDGFTASARRPLIVRGHAWSGHTPVAAVDVSVDGGATWQPANLGILPDTFAWRRFDITYDNLPCGPIEIMARATDAAGRMQPLDSVPWNPRGYCNNIVHRVHGRLR